MVIFIANTISKRDLCVAKIRLNQGNSNIYDNDSAMFNRKKVKR